VSFLPNVKGGSLVKVKVMALIFVVVVATVATSIVVNLSSQIAEENTDFTEYNTLQIDDDEVGVELLAEIDTPGAPG